MTCHGVNHVENILIIKLFTNTVDGRKSLPVGNKFKTLYLFEHKLPEMIKRSKVLPKGLSSEVVENLVSVF